MTKEPWHVDRRIPIALIIAILTPTITGIWWMSKLDGRVAENAADISQSVTRIHALEESDSAKGVTIARMDERFRAIQDILARIERKLEKQGE